MNQILTRLGISSEIQAFFNVPSNLSFSYGDQHEQFDVDFHRVPATQNIWFAGTQNATHLIITYSVMEAMAFITLTRPRYPRLEQLAFVAIGNRFHAAQAHWIRQNFPGRKVTLVFGKDLIGRITDIKLAAAIKNIPIRIIHSNTKILVYRDNWVQIFSQDLISLHAFQEAFGIRPRFRTGKPPQSLTFLDQLKNDADLNREFLSLKT
ncbi:hypothetical protein SAMN05421821_101243 [Mucilaginibacter lappiensis]|uniref:Uncharacterized protein n=1 Tax=Mucilaginibacter lappiensis TaxID=354630 RepID=A0ABR6PDK5_9SPHI|nr:hypothetical protein [Mucilaginibacter lappiensis]MBB6107845.1 hypothetical protein [Mucilaginibacter lappiensis]SIP95194.1 hypothetical protein SAMN05421821_101243 [Mucilaginibacter lappiensis]